MNSNEWALIIFTILGQMSVGAFLILGIVRLYATHKAGAAEADRLSDRALIAIILTMGLGLLASIFHLGNPINAPRAITNLATSWLSREIFFGVGFGLLGAVYAIMQWFKLGTAQVRNVIAWLAGLVGIVLVFCMARAYMLPTQPAWNSLATPISFYATSLLLGSLALGAAFFINYTINLRRQPDCADCQTGLLRDVLSGISILAIVMLGVEFVVTPIYIASMASQGGAGLSSVRLMGSTFRATYVIRLVLAFLGAGIFGVFIFQTAKQDGQIQRLGTLAISAFALVLVAEVLGRYLFYATRVAIGIF